jgi:hypothetical protein
MSSQTAGQPKLYQRNHFMDTQPNALTTIQRYSPIARAEEKAAEARQAYTAAGLKYMASPTLANSDALTAARKAMDEAEQVSIQAGQIWKHGNNKRRPVVKVDGTDTTLKAQLEDAGFGDFGPL